MKSLEFSIPRKFEPFLTKKKRYKIAVGGRGSGKSMTMADILLHRVAQYGDKVLCMREFQSSIADSSHALLKSEIKRIQIPGFKETLIDITHNSTGELKFKGLARNIDAIKSFHGFNVGFVEEAQFLSEESIRILTPTFREEDSEIWLAANPGSSDDPFSKTFLNPFWDELIEHGFYEDDLHYIVKVDYCDNPFFPEVLELERQKDYKLLSRGMYDHVWRGMFNDSVENALIDAEWFDACIDAHKKLGFEPIGMRFSSHDPSDKGPDSKGYSFRHGSVLLDLQEKIDGDVNEGCDWATGLAITNQSDAYTWDCDGMGIGLNQQVERVFKGKHTILSMFKGSEGVDNPDSIFEPVTGIQDQRTIKQAIKNKRGQYYFELRKRVYRTWEAVVKGVYHDPDTLISFSSDIKILSKLRSELCRMPVKPNGNGLFELYTKQVMKDKFKFKSPNLADAVMMLMRAPHKIVSYDNVRPQPIKTIGRR